MNIREWRLLIFSSNETIRMVKEWLNASGVSTERIRQSHGLNWITFNATTEEAESLLKTKYHVYEHESGQPHVACEEYSLPLHLKDKIDFVLPSTHFDAKIRRSSRSGHAKRQLVTTGRPTLTGEPRFGQYLDSSSMSSGFGDCDEYITPDCLRTLYQLPDSMAGNSNSSLGVVEYAPQAYLPDDLDMFFGNFSEKQVGERPILKKIDGGVIQTEDESYSYNSESDLDLEYAMTLVYPQKVTLYQVGDIVEGASFNNFLDAFDESYCDGDDSSEDAVYPDPYSGSGSYDGSETCGGLSPAKVISTSYSYDEADLSSAYVKRQCNEYMKLGLMGTTVIYSSGDNGVGGAQGCLNDDGSFNDGSSGRFNPSFPGTCPYVLSVGATQVKSDTDVKDAVASGTQSEKACETSIYSGGGFSNVFDLPSYQESAVQDWFSDYPPSYDSDRFNNSQKTRGFPDVSANGANYVVASDGDFALVYGTSAAAPTFASVLTFINEARYNASKSSIGFVNHVLYANSDVLNDVTEGSNNGCGTDGFSAAPGWDPVTGLGTPNYPKMKELFLSLS